jgi:hypothetical protein
MIRGFVVVVGMDGTAVAQASHPPHGVSGAHVVQVSQYGMVGALKG